MKKTLFLTILCFLISSYINAQDSLYMKCKELPGFSLQNSINLEDSLIINIFDNKYNIVFSQDIQSLTYSDTTISDIDFFEIQLPESKYLGYEDSIGDPSLLMFGGYKDDPIIQYGKESINLEENIIHNIDAFKDILLNNSCFAYAYDVNGKLIISDNSNNIISKLNTFPFGVYFVYLQGNNISKLYKLIINK